MPDCRAGRDAGVDRAGGEACGGQVSHEGHPHLRPRQLAAFALERLGGSLWEQPFFEYYADDFRPFYTQKWDFLFDFNEAIRRKVCELLDLQTDVHLTVAYGLTDVPADDFRNAISPKVPFEADADFVSRPYYQVFREKHGFLPGLSVADLLFNMGPEALLVLRDSVRG